LIMDGNGKSMVPKRGMVSWIEPSCWPSVTAYERRGVSDFCMYCILVLGAGLGPGWSRVPKERKDG
jgi:hypothetical protein